MDRVCLPPVIVRHLRHEELSQHKSAGKGGRISGDQQSGNEGGYGQAGQELAQHARWAEVQHLCDDLEALIIDLQVWPTGHETMICAQLRFTIIAQPNSKKTLCISAGQRLVQVLPQNAYKL